jgi:Recombinase
LRSREAPATLPPATAESPSERRRRFGYKIIYHDLGEGSKRQRRIVGEELEPAEAKAIKEAASRVLRGESIRSIAFDFNDRGIKPVGGGRWVGSTLRRMPGIAQDRGSP